MQDNPSLALAAQTIDGFYDLYSAMRRDKSLVKDRTWHLRLFPTTFLGDEMVGWIASYCAVSREEAVAIGDRMLQAEVWHHVCRDHAFKDGYLYYRFAEDTTDSSVLNMRKLWPPENEVRNPMLVSMSVLNSLLSLIKIHQANKPVGSDGYAEVDIDSLREDEAFFSFRIAAGELQSVDLNYLQSKSSKMAFLLNILHTLVLHSRIINKSSFRNRNQFWATSRLEYNIAGHRITVRALTECLGMDITEARDNAARSSNFPSSRSQPRPRRRDTPPPRPKGVKAPRSTVRRSDGFQSVFRLLRYEREKGELLELFVNDGSPSCLPLKVCDENSVSETTLRQRLCQFLVRTMEINTEKCTMVLPSMMRNYRQITGLVSDRQLILDIVKMLEYSAMSSPDDEDEREGQNRYRVVEALNCLVKDELPFHVAIAKPKDKYFAPEIQVWQFDPGNGD